MFVNTGLREKSHENCFGMSCQYVVYALRWKLYKILDEEGIKYDVIRWDRFQIEEINEFVFRDS